jgi:hypothetical protein
MSSDLMKLMSPLKDIATSGTAILIKLEGLSLFANQCWQNQSIVLNALAQAITTRQLRNVCM